MSGVSRANPQRLVIVTDEHRVEQFHLAWQAGTRPRVIYSQREPRCRDQAPGSPCAGLAVTPCEHRGTYEKACNMNVSQEMVTN